VGAIVACRADCRPAGRHWLHCHRVERARCVAMATGSDQVSFDRKEWKRQWRLKNPEKVREQNRRATAKRVRTSAQRREESLRQRYSLTVGQVLEMAEVQQQTCPLCVRVIGRSERPGNGFVVDHCHETGRVRGLLCRACNTLLGRFGDDPTKIEEFLSRVRSYLERV